MTVQELKSTTGREQIIGIGTGGARVAMGSCLGGRCCGVHAEMLVVLAQRRRSSGRSATNSCRTTWPVTAAPVASAVPVAVTSRGETAAGRAGEGVGGEAASASKARYHNSSRPVRACARLPAGLQASRRGRAGQGRPGQARAGQDRAGQATGGKRGDLLVSAVVSALSEA